MNAKKIKAAQAKKKQIPILLNCHGPAGALSLSGQTESGPDPGAQPLCVCMCVGME
jgi:hypothetical protein